MTIAPPCQNCAAPLTQTWLDLGEQPLANTYLADADAARDAKRYPLHARVCHQCFLVQVESVLPPAAIFSDYAYFSSVSDSWIEHCRRYAAATIARFGLGPDSLVVEVASNDGYLLRHFKHAGVPVLGIEPAANIAAVAQAEGIPTEIDFFGAALARRLIDEGKRADHISAKNVLAHVPRIADFIEGVAILLKPEAVFDVEFPHLLRTIEGLQFDQIYHEHFTYLSLVAITRIMAGHGLRVFDVDELPTHGGSLRVYACHRDAPHQTTERVAAIEAAERTAMLDRPEGYQGFAGQVADIRTAFLDFVDGLGDNTLAGYGAAAKGNTFLNYCGVDTSVIPFIADRSKAKIGRRMPGSAIPIVSPETMLAERPDRILILPWNLKKEVATQLESARAWDARFVTAIPRIDLF